MVFHDVPWKGRDEQDLAKNIYSKPLVFKNSVQISKFTEEFLRKALTIDESERLSWDNVFSMVDA
jgi:calcium-dependent protein kinase